MLQCLELEVDSVEAKEAAQQRPSSETLDPKKHTSELLCTLGNMQAFLLVLFTIVAQVLCE